jgi:hypothetical protein
LCRRTIERDALAAGLACQPCRALINPPCGATEAPACLRAITVEQVVSAAWPTLAAARSQPDSAADPIIGQPAPPC